MDSKYDNDKDNFQMEEAQPLSAKNPVKKKRKTVLEKVLQHFRDYCGCTSIHGMGYFSQDRTCIEYCWWIFVITLSVCGSLFMIHQIYVKWVESPVIVSFATKDRPIYKHPFPAVTLCPINRVRGEVFNLTEYVEAKQNEEEYEIDEEETTKNYTRKDILAGYVSAMCDETVEGLDEKYFNESDFFSFVKESAIDMGFSIVQLQREGGFFVSKFRESFTPNGLCYTFNALGLDEIYTDIVERFEIDDTDTPKSQWDQEEGYQKDAGVHAYPRRALTKGEKEGMILLLMDRDSGFDHECDPLSAGYMIHIHYPSRVVSESEGIRAQLNSVTMIGIEATMMETSPRVKNYSPSKRDCYFPSERSLKYFKNYTQKNCELECLTNYTLKACDCVRFYMPREKVTPICGPGKASCYNSVSEKLTYEALEKLISESDDTDENYDPLDGCDCRPMCTDVQYKTNVEILKLDPHQIKYFGKSIAGESFRYTMIGIYFLDDKMPTRERNELYGPTDFLSNFGGLMGLFTGFSVLSSMEILYFLTLRIFGNLRLFGRWYGPNS